MRRTDQALIEVITQASQELLIVSFAVYKIPTIGEAIVQAAARGVRIRICVEAPEPGGQKIAYDTIQALGPAVAAVTGIYIWPTSRRLSDAGGRTGVLHTKCAVADRRLLFISSANLTDYALNVSMTYREGSWGTFGMLRPLPSTGGSCTSLFIKMSSSCDPSTPSKAHTCCHARRGSI